MSNNLFEEGNNSANDLINKEYYETLFILVFIFYLYNLCFIKKDPYTQNSCICF